MFHSFSFREKKGYQEMKEKRISGLNSFKLNDFKIYL